VKLYSKGKGVPVHGMIVYGTNRGTVPLILNLCTRWWRLVKFWSRPLLPSPLPPREKLPVPIGCVTEPVWSFGEERDLLSLPEFKPWVVQPRSLVITAFYKSKNCLSCRGSRRSWYTDWTTDWTVTETSRPTLMLIQPHIQWVPGFSPGGKAAGAWISPLTSI